MKIDSVYVNAFKVACVIFLLGIIEFVIFTICKGFRTDILYGVLFGCTFSSASFFYLAYNVKKCVEKDEKAAKAYMSASYTSRMLLTAAMIIISAKVEFIHLWAAVIPLAFTRIAATIVPLLNKRRNKD